MTHSLRTVATVAMCALVGSLQACSKAPAGNGAAKEPLTFRAQAPIPVTLALLKAEGEIGRSTGIRSNYQPVARFALGSVETSCQVELPPSTPELPPGESTTALLRCDSEVRAEAGKTDFGLFEGGREVGRGSVQLP